MGFYCLVGFKYLKKYISALQRLFVVDEVLSWNTNLRSKTAIRAKNTRYFVDPSIAAASLGLTPQKIANLTTKLAIKICKY